MMASTITQIKEDGVPHTTGLIRSILDTDLYKLTMQQALLRHYPDKHVTYKFTNRSREMKFTAQAVQRIQSCISALESLRLTNDEYQWLKLTCPYFRKDYLDFLASFRFDPQSQVKVEFKPTTKDDGSKGDLEMSIRGLWKDVILYEVPLMAIISQCYFEMIDTQWTLTGQRKLASRKAYTMSMNGIRYSEFGTRRRRSYTTHKIVVEGLIEGDKKARETHPANPGAFLGTSNLHFAMLYNLVPIGTVAHEWTMAIAALEGYTQVNLKALHKWDQVYSPPDFVPNSPTHDLTIALTDTFSTQVFFDDLFSNEKGIEIAKRWRGLRQDSGDSKAFALKAKQMYQQIGVDPKTKVVIYSDSLDVDKCLDLVTYSKEIGIGAAFGVGTNLTNDFVKATQSSSSTEEEIDSEPPKGEKSKALNMVIKLDKVQDKHVVKISDDLTKNTGDPDQVRMVKRRFGLDGNEHVEDA